MMMIYSYPIQRSGVFIVIDNNNDCTYQGTKVCSSGIACQESNQRMMMMMRTMMSYMFPNPEHADILLGNDIPHTLSAP